jgi:septal ring factor EnvC (AmiA/AmiB activator)
VADAVQRVGIEIDIDAGNVAARIKAIEKQLKAMEKTVARMDRKGSGINDTFKKLDKRMGRMGQAIKGYCGCSYETVSRGAAFAVFRWRSYW